MHVFDELGGIPAISQRFDTVVEPFCGSAALSLEMHSRPELKRLRYVLNDTDPDLIRMLRFVANEGSEALYAYCRDRLNPEEFMRHHHAAETTRTGLSTMEYFYRNRVTGPLNRRTKPPEKWPSLKRGPKQVDTDACLAAATITCDDWRTCVDAHKNNSRALIFLDPPYFNSFNSEYYGYGGVKVRSDGSILDATGMILEILDYLKGAAATIVVITNSSMLTDYVYSPFIKKRYAKKYSRVVKVDGKYVQKSTHHVLLSNVCSGCGLH